MKAREVKLLSEQGAKEYLEKLINALDDIEKDDFFGTEGWRKYIMGEDDD